MLVEEHWGTYTSHGWIARSEDMKFIVGLYKPLSEREIFQKLAEKMKRNGLAGF